MANIFNEVDEDIRKERYQSLWNKYGKYVISLIVLIIVIFSISQYSKQKNIIDNKKLLDIYYSAAEKIEINQYELANKSLVKKEFDIKINVRPKINYYDLIVIAVKHDQFYKIGIKKIRSFCNKKGFIYDIKSMFSIEDVDASL